MANKVRDASEISTVNMDEISIPKSPQNNEKLKDVDLVYELRHIFRVMGVFGLYHTPKRWRIKSKQFSCSAALYKFHRVYCFLVQILQWLSVIRYIVSIWVGEESTLDSSKIVLKITLCLWCLQTAVNSTIWYCLCCSDKLPTIFDFWQKNCQSSPASREFGTSLPTSCTQTFIKVVLVGSCFGLVANVSGPIIGAIGPLESIRNDSRFIYAPFDPENTTWQVISFLVLIYANAAYVLPVGFFVILCLILSYQFQQFSTAFASGISTDGKFTKCLRSLRRQHQYLSKTVFLADGAFSFYLAATVAACISLACFNLYTLIISRAYSGVATASFLVYWVAGVCVNFSLVGVFAARVNEKVRKQMRHILYHIIQNGFKMIRTPVYE